MKISKYIYILIFLFLILYYAIDFIKNIESNFSQFIYDWDKITIIKNHSNIDIDSLSYNFLAIKNTINPISIKNTFSLENDKKKYYFRAKRLNKKDDKVYFNGVYWVNGLPSLKNKNNNQLNEIDLPIIKKGTKTINSFGDAFMAYNESKYLNRTIYKKNNLEFIGARKDFFGFQTDAYLNSNSSIIAKNILNFKIANYYIVFIGANDNSFTFDKIKKNWTTILNVLTERERTNKIMIISLPPSENKIINEFHIKYNELLKTLTKNYKTVILIDSFKNLDSKKYITNDEKFPNKNGYLIIAKSINKVLNEN
jgi:hypothetical protein